MKTRYALIIGAVVIVAAYVVMSFMGVSVDSSGQFSRLDDGQMLYTHHLTNLTWHPIRYTVAADPGSQVQTTLVRWDSSDPENTVAKMESGSGSSPWSVTLDVPAHQEASIKVIFQLAEPLPSASPSAKSEFGGLYPGVKVLLSVNK